MIKCFLCLDSGVVRSYDESHGLKYEKLYSCRCRHVNSCLPTTDELTTSQKAEIIKNNEKIMESKRNA